MRTGSHRLGDPALGVRFAQNAFCDLSMVLRRLLDERAIFVRRAEIDIDAFDPVTIEGEKLRVPEILAAFGYAPIGHKGLIAVDEDLLEFVALDPVAVAPAALAIGRLVDLVVIWAREMEIVRKRILADFA